MMRPVALAVAFIAASAPAAAALLPGPIPATVVGVIDGDSLRVHAQVWPGITAVGIVRIRGIDAPEVRGPKCPEERALAGRALDRVVALMVEGGRISLTDVEPDKFGGRFVAHVLAGGVDVGASLVAEGLARPYDGRAARLGWCDSGEEP